MVEIFLVIFFILVFVNVVASIYFSWKNLESYHFFTQLHDKYGNNYVYSSIAAVALVFIFGLIFKNSIVFKILIPLITIAFGIVMYFDLIKGKWGAK